MQFRYTVQEKDYVDYFLYRNSIDDKFQKNAKRNNLILSLLYFFFGLSNIFKESYVAGVAFIIAGIFFYIFNPKFNRCYYKKYYGRKVKKTMGDQINIPATIEFNGSKVILKDDQSPNEHIFNAQEFATFVLLPSSSLLLFTKESGLIIPNATLDQSEDFHKNLEDFATKNAIKINDQRISKGS